jgi:hypothetical protein
MAKYIKFNGDDVVPKYKFPVPLLREEFDRACP